MAANAEALLSRILAPAIDISASAGETPLGNRWSSNDHGENFHWRRPCHTLHLNGFALRRASSALPPMASMA